MSYRIISLSYFDKQAKRLVRKYPSLKQELITLIGQLQSNPAQGTSIGNSCYKIRVAIASKGKGKSVAERVLFHAFILIRKMFICSPFMIKRSSKIFRISRLRRF